MGQGALQCAAARHPSEVTALLDSESEEQGAVDAEVASSETDPEYLRWSSERLQHLLDQEEARRQGLERKALAASAFALAMASYFARQVAGAEDKGMFFLFVSILALVGLLLTLFLAYRTVAVKEHKAPNPSALCRDEVLLQPSGVTYLGYQQHLGGALDALREQIAPKADLSERTQVFALLTTALLVVVLFMNSFLSVEESVMSEEKPSTPSQQPTPKVPSSPPSDGGKRPQPAPTELTDLKKGQD